MALLFQKQRYPVIMKLCVIIGLYAYRQQFLQTYPRLSPAPLENSEALEQLRVLWHGYPIAVHVTHEAPHAGVDTPEEFN